MTDMFNKNSNNLKRVKSLSKKVSIDIATVKIILFIIFTFSLFVIYLNDVLTDSTKDQLSNNIISHPLLVESNYKLWLIDLETELETELETDLKRKLEQKGLKITDNFISEKNASFSTNGQYIAYLSNKSGEFQIWLRNNKGLTRQLSDSPTSLNSHYLKWSPDDQNILFDFNDEVFSIRINSGKISRLIENIHQPHDASWSIDSNSLFYTTNKTKDWQVYQYQLLNKQHRLLTKISGDKIVQRKNSDLLIFGNEHFEVLSKNTNNINAFKTEATVLTGLHFLNGKYWQLYNDKIYYLEKDISQRSKEKPLLSKSEIRVIDIETQSNELFLLLSQNITERFFITDNRIVVSSVENETVE